MAGPRAVEIHGPDVAEIDEICAIVDPAVRNLRITECYGRLAAAFAATGVDGANWCAFATWASRQAGRTIRGEDLIERLAAGSPRGSPRHPLRALWRWLLRRGLFRPATRLGRVVREVHTPFDAFELASQAVARGNLAVFAEIGREFARYLAMRRTNESIDGFLAALRPGPAPDGQDGLRHAFLHYEQQRRTPDPATRRALVLLANLEIGLHEQTRLQPAIVAALESGADAAEDLGSRALACLVPGVARRGGTLCRVLSAVLAAPARRYCRYAREATRKAVTESLMVLRVPPDLELSLGRHLPYAVPREFRASSVAELGEFWAGCTRDRAPDDCGADDWGDLGQRMHYILHLFAVFHDRPELFASPFDPEQVRRIRAGELPEGSL
ncbi:MAG TPA: hypothetical protein PLU44_00550 [Candidatus Krumholzibacteria bacterium]|nr:hypothetical protein [Candidatus Krumholzibacteria bacterium]HRY40050.1 hypothetical protein [Candidatus Krumholzibacteria bacterium]